MKTVVTWANKLILLGCQVVETAAPKGVGLAELEEAVLLQAEVMDLQASAGGRAEGTVVEARRDKGQGPVATVIVKRGRLQARPNSLSLTCNLNEN